MPSKTQKQARFMQAVAHSPKFAAKAGVPQAVGQEFAAADKGAPAKMAKGGVVRGVGCAARGTKFSGIY